MQPNFNADGDWEDRGGVLWNEHDWQRYLKASDADVLRFLSTYLKHRHEKNHLDIIALRLGWDKLDWNNASEWADDDAQEDQSTNDSWEEELQESSETAMGIPYTVHRHPVFIATRGLAVYIGRSWHDFFAQHSHVLPAVFAWDLFAALHAAELNAVMAIHAVELGDFNLGICHLKNGLSAINHAFSILQRVPKDIQPQMHLLLKDTHDVLFDLRELWLRVIQDCREQAHYDSDSEEDWD